MSKNKKDDLALQLNEQFNYYIDSEDHAKFSIHIQKDGELSSNDISSLFNHMVTINNSDTQHGAIINVHTIKKIWNSLQLLSNKNISLEEENIRLNEKLERIRLHTNKLFNEFDR